MEQIVFQGANSDHPLVVSDRYPLRNLRFTTESRQSCIDLQNPHILQLAYTRWMMSALLFTGPPERILLLGLGGGSLVHFLLHHHPQVHLDVVEKSKTVIQLSKGYFRLPVHNNLQIHHRDAESFLRNTKAHSPRYDLILIDIFGADSMAPPLYQQDFFSHLYNCLGEKGVMAANLWGADKKEFSRAQTALDKGCNRQSLQLKIPKKGNIISLGFRQQITRTILTRARYNIISAQQHYTLSFNRYWKRLLRDNPILFFRLLTP